MAKKVALISFKGADPCVFPIVWQVYYWPRYEGDKPFFETTITDAGAVEYPIVNRPVSTVVSFGDGTVTLSDRYGTVFLKGPFTPAEKRGQVIVTLPQ